MTTLARNTTLLTAAYVLQKLGSFLYFMVIARLLGAAATGQYGFAVSFASLFTVAMDVGLTSVVIRETAKDPGTGERYVRVVLTAKVLICAAVLAVLALALFFIDKPALVRGMAFLVGMAMALDAGTLTLWGALRAHHTIRNEAVSVLVNQAIIMAVGITAVVSGAPLWALAVALCAGSLWSLLYALWSVRRILGYRLTPVWEYSLFSGLLLMSYPFALAGIFNRVYSYIDHVLLSLLIDDRTVGWYSIGYKITFAFQFIPAAAVAALYPLMSAYYARERDKLAPVFERSLLLMAALSAPVAGGIWALARPLIAALYGAEYAPTVDVLHILVPSLIFVCLSYPIGSLLNAADRQGINTFHMATTMVFNILLNMILIPRYAHIGAAWATLASWALLVTMNLAQVPSIISPDWKRLSLRIAAVAASAACMVAIVRASEGYIPLPAQIALGMAVYPALVFALRGMTIGELRSLWASLGSKSYAQTAADNA